MVENKRRKKFIGTPVQRKLLFLIFASAVIPTGLVTISLYYLIFVLFAWQLGIPEAIECNLIPVLNKINLIIFIALPVVLLFIWVIALELSHRLAGPIFRLERELDARILGLKRGPIRLRKKDELKSLTDKINKVLNP